MNISIVPDLILHNGRITTLDPKYPEAKNLAVKDGRIVGVDEAEEYERGPDTKVIDLQGRRVIPGLNDSHLHVIRGGLNYNMELRWDGVPSLADALRMLKEQAQRTPVGQWVRVVGGWTEFQFAERRMPTLEEINAAAPNTPVFILHLYCRALLNQAALRACGYTKDTPNPPGGEIQRDHGGNPTGLLIARPNATILYATLAKGPKLPPEHQMNSTRHFMRELNRLGLTSIIDAGGGFQNYPEDYAIIEELHKRGEMTVRIAYNLFTQKPKQEKADFARWIKMTGPGKGDDFFRCNGAGEMLVFSAADFEDFLEPRPDLPASLEGELKEVVSLLAANKWPFRLHATYDESISRFLNVFEEVNREVPFKGLNWFFDHCETVTDRNLERIKALGGGIAVQHRMAYQGEYFMDRYGKKAAERTPPIRKMLELEIPVGAGTDATRVASYNPWVSLYWLVTGKTVGGVSMYPDNNRLSREEALRLYTQGSSWFSSESGKKGALAAGQLADFVALTDDSLQPNGGATLTFGLLSDSPAIDAGDDSLLSSPLNLALDQRGKPRLSGAHVDIGTVEYDGIVNGGVAPPRLTSAVSASPGMQFWFNGCPGLTYSVWASTNLATWFAVGSASEVSRGWFFYGDSGSSVRQGLCLRFGP